MAYVLGSTSTYDITRNGSAIDSTCQIWEIQVSKNLGRPDFASISIIWDFTGTPPFTHGDEIQIKLGYDSRDSTVFSGKLIETKYIVSTSLRTAFIISCESAYTNTTEDKESKITLRNYDNILSFVAQSNAQYKLTGDVVSMGSNLINPGNYLTLSGFNSQINGDYQTTQVIHHIADGNWNTSYHFEEKS